jgi:nucleoside-diphosphate-sugar epimerase
LSRVLVLGGTRDIGHFAALELFALGHSVTVLNRGVTRDELPEGVERLHADRSASGALRRAIGTRDFDLVLDTTTYDRRDARDAIETFTGRAGHYAFVSSGQVYLVRAGVSRPYRESDYEGPLIPEPPSGTDDHDGWSYGIGKREAEEIFADAWRERRFPVTALRLPMVASERDPAGRIQAYIARLRDGGPLLLPLEPGHALRHVYVADVARVVAALAGGAEPAGEALNVSYGESLALRAFIELLAGAADREVEMIEVPRGLLEQEALLPGCSPFSSRWMSELDNTRSLALLDRHDLRYTPPAEYVRHIVRDYIDRWEPLGLIPDGYESRGRERVFLHAWRA